MYYAHFGLSQPPFRITPNTDFFFDGGNRGPILEALLYALNTGEGIVKVTGEVGSGKTMLCNMLQTRLPENIETVYLANPSVSPDEILHAIAFELQLGLPRNASRLEVMHGLHEFLLKRFAEGRRVVVFVEESQGMPLATLEEIRLLSNLETQNDKLLQIILFGQPELDVNLREPHIRQLRERITHSFRLEPLTEPEIREYLMFRMRAAGYRGPDLFSTAVVSAITRASNGLTRRVNLIADKALLAAFAENTHTVKPKHVEAAIRDSEFSRDSAPARARPGLAWAALLVIAGGIAGALGYAILQKPETNGSIARPADAAGVAARTAAAQQTADTEQPAKSNTAPPTPTATPTTEKEKPLETTRYVAPAAPSSPPAATVTAAAPTVTARVEITAAPKQAEPVAPKVETQPDLLAQRLAATTQWLAQENPSVYSIQLLGSGDDDELRNNLSQIAKSIEINDIFVYRTVANKRPFTTVLVGRFNARKEALEALEKLPAVLKANRPLLRTVGGMREELRTQKGA